MQQPIIKNNHPIIPYGHQWIDEADIEAVVDVLRSDWLTTGPKVSEFEQAVADFVGVKEAVAVSSGTAALHAAMYAIGIKPGDEVILSPMTFAATANAIVFQGGNPVFADVEPETLLIDPDQAQKKITRRTKAIIAVDYGGHPCDYDGLQKITDAFKLNLIDDACHALGARYKGRNLGALADQSIFSFHPVKHITTAEGGIIVTDDSEAATRLRLFRNHGISSEFRQRESRNSWYYEMIDLGYNYRISDIQCALGISQLRKLGQFIDIRREIACYYDEALDAIEGVIPLSVRSDVWHAYHLYVVKLDKNILGIDRNHIFKQMRKLGIGVNVHYIPVHLHPFYRQNYNTNYGLCPVAEEEYKHIMSLPIHQGMSKEDAHMVIDRLTQVVNCS